MIAFTVGILPRGKGAARAGRIGNHARVFTDPKTRDYMHTFAALAIEYAPDAPLTTPLNVRLVFVFPFLQGWPKWKREAAEAGLVSHDTKPDVDNLQKAALDALTKTGRFWRDDALITRVSAVKVYGEVPGTQVEIHPREVWTRESFAARRTEKALPDAIGLTHGADQGEGRNAQPVASACARRRYKMEGEGGL